MNTNKTTSLDYKLSGGQEVHPKWIIDDGHLIIGKCRNHVDLINTTQSKVRGGGWFNIDLEAGVILLYGSSADFGYASVDDVTAAVQNGYCDSPNVDGLFNNYSYLYSTLYKLEEAKRNCLAIDKVAKGKEDDL